MSNLQTSPRADAPVALVTGSGSQRLGNAVVRALAARGYRVALHALSSITGAEQTAAELQAAGGEAVALAADLRDERAVAVMVERTVRHFGQIDALVNCAAVWPSKRLEDITAADVREAMEINLLGTFLCCQNVGLVMTSQPSGGAIVNFGDWAVRRPYLDYAAYFASKGAIPALTRTFATELASRNPRVRVNAILPGPVMLPASLSAEEREAAVAGTLLRREGSPQNIVQAVEFLLENDYITGVSLPVDGGRSIHGG